MGEVKQKPYNKYNVYGKHADVDKDKKKDVIRDEDEVERDVTGISEDSDNDDGEGDVVVITRPPGDARSHIDVNVSHGGEEELKVLEVEQEEARVEDRVAEDQFVNQDVEQDVLTDDTDDPEAVRTVEEPEIEPGDDITAGEDDDGSEVRDEQERRPVPTPRRSTRQRRLPDRYGHNIMSAMQMESTDRRLEDISALVANGVFNNMDSEAVHRILSSLIN